MKYGCLGPALAPGEAGSPGTHSYQPSIGTTQCRRATAARNAGLEAAVSTRALNRVGRRWDSLVHDGTSPHRMARSTRRGAAGPTASSRLSRGTSSVRTGTVVVGAMLNRGVGGAVSG